MNWDFLDYIAAFILLSGLAGGVFLITKKLRHHKILAIVALILAIALIWAELAVGVFGSPFAGD